MEKEKYRPYMETLFNEQKANKEIRKIIGRIIPEIKEIDKFKDNKHYTWASCPECQGLLPVRKWHINPKAPATWSFELAICETCKITNKAWQEISVLYRANDGEVVSVTTEKAALNGMINTRNQEKESIIVSMETACRLLEKMHPLNQH